MSDTLTEPRFVHVKGEGDSPAVFHPGWLPDIETFPELTQAREEWFRLRDAWQAAGEHRRVIEEKIQNDKERRELDLKHAYLAGDEAKLEAEDETLKAELVEAQAQGQAAASAFVEHINRCIALVIERRESWFASIDLYQQEIDEEVRALMEQAARLRTKRGNFGRFELWVERTGGRVRPPTADRPGINFCGADEPHAHFQYAMVPMPASGDVAEEEARAAEAFMRAYAGGDGKQRPLDDAQGAALEQHVMSGPTQEPEQPVELSDLDEDDITDWLMGTGWADGKPKPGPDLVVAVAEENPEMVQRLLKAESRASGDKPRKEVVDQLNKIGGAQ
jgi:hypothetical protein